MTEISDEQKRIVKELYIEPDERASWVWGILQDMSAHLRESKQEDFIPSDLDLLCFAIEFVGQQAIAIDNDTFFSMAVDMERWLWSVHYSNPQRLYGAPNREDHPATRQPAGPATDTGSNGASTSATGQTPQGPGPDTGA